MKIGKEAMRTTFEEKKELYEFYIKRKIYWLSHYFISDEAFIRIKHKYRVGENLNLENPRTFNEKLQWLKLNWRKDICTVCADKYAVRDYVSKNLGNEFLNELYSVFEKVEDIDPQKLPDAFVLKVTHGCGQNFICRNKNDMDWPFVFKALNIYMDANHYYHGKEWAYKNIKPRIVCEKVLEEGGKSPNDYKIFCFNGEPKIIQVDSDRFEQHKRNLFELNWNPIDVVYTYPRSEYVEKPEMLGEMIEYAKKLSRGFPFVRVDFYSIKNKVIFGEMTFYPDSGSNRFVPKQFDDYLGDFMTLPGAD